MADNRAGGIPSRRRARSGGCRRHGSIGCVADMPKSRWQEVGDHYNRDDAEAQIAKMRADDKAAGRTGIKYRLREERRQSRFTSYGETRYVVSYLSPGVY